MWDDAWRGCRDFHGRATDEVTNIEQRQLGGCLRPQEEPSFWVAFRRDRAAQLHIGAEG